MKEDIKLGEWYRFVSQSTKDLFLFFINKKVIHGYSWYNLLEFDFFDVVNLVKNEKWYSDEVETVKSSTKIMLNRKLIKAIFKNTYL